MICRYCGKNIPDDSRFCENCGKEIVVDLCTGQKDFYKKRSGTKKVIAVVFCVLFCVILGSVAVLVAWKFRSKPDTEPSGRENVVKQNHDRDEDKSEVEDDFDKKDQESDSEDKSNEEAVFGKKDSDSDDNIDLSEKASFGSRVDEDSATDKLNSYMGTWEATKASGKGADGETVEMDASDIYKNFTLTLNADGKASVNLNGEESNGTWEEVDNGIMIDDEMFFRDEGGKLVVEASGAKIVFEKKIFDGNEKTDIFEKDNNKDKDERAVFKGGKFDYIFSYSDTRRLTKDEIEELIDNADDPLWSVRLAINELYARHGRMFVDSDIRNYFEGKNWYEGTVEADLFDKNQSDFFNEVEIYNRDLLVKYKKKLEKRQN